MQNAGGKWAKQGVEAFTFSVKLFPKLSFCESWGSALSPGRGHEDLAHQ